MLVYSVTAVFICEGKVDIDERIGLEGNCVQVSKVTVRVTSYERHVTASQRDGKLHLE